MKIRGLILDVDGTLIDSNDAHARAWAKAFADEGHQVSVQEVRPLIGMGSDQLVPQLTGIQKDTPEFERLGEGWKKHFEEELPQIQAQPGAKALVEALLARNLKLVVGTSGEGKLVEKLLDIADVAQLLPLRTTAADVEASKPAPDIVQAALSKLGLEAQNVLMLGDTPFDIESAARSGVKTVALRCGGDNRLEEAAAVYDSPADLLEHLADLEKM